MTRDEQPDKPPIDIPAAPVEPPTDQEEHEMQVGGFLEPHEAAFDDTIDDEERVDD